jgi:DNA mismatch repair protein MutL
MAVRRLDPVLVDRIAAGEVVERPAAAVKELVENALDAGARRIDIVVEAGGKRLIRVSDDGCGMGNSDLDLAVERHATSKLEGDDLTAIATLGFRGEALPAMASVARLEIHTRARGDEHHGYTIVVDAGIKSAVMPSAHPIGTRVEIAALFAATPARLKFLKSDRAEAQAVADCVKRLAMAHPRVGFTLQGDHLHGLNLSPCSDDDNGVAERLTQILGREFRDNALTIDAVRDGVSTTGFASLPTYHRANAQAQFLFVNGRSVRDKMLAAAVRAAYRDYLPFDRFPIVALFVVCDPHFVDVNVHPAKAEVRFRDSGLVRGLIIGALKEAIAGANYRASTSGGTKALDALSRTSFAFRDRSAGAAAEWTRDWSDPSPQPVAAGPAATSSPAAVPHAALVVGSRPQADTRADLSDDADYRAFPLGAARAQLHETYIVAQTHDGLVLVDQHAAHERLVYERMKRALAAQGIERQLLLIPEIVELEEAERQLLLSNTNELERLGLSLESFGPGAVAVREVPSLLKDSNISRLIRDIGQTLAEDDASALPVRLDRILATMACHHSVRAGRRLKAEEMDALLRAMEQTPGAGQCNHGRPTYVELKLSDIERLFGRR